MKESAKTPKKKLRQRKKHERNILQQRIKHSWLITIIKLGSVRPIDNRQSLIHFHQSRKELSFPPKRC